MSSQVQVREIFNHGTHLLSQRGREGVVADAQALKTLQNTVGSLKELWGHAIQGAIDFPAPRPQITHLGGRVIDAHTHVCGHRQAAGPSPARPDGARGSRGTLRDGDGWRGETGEIRW